MKHSGQFASVLIAVLSLSAISVGKTTHDGYDGRFCASNGYLAFDYLENDVSRAGHVMKTTHLLKIVRFGPKHNIYFSGVVNLPANLAIKWMNCNTERVEVAGPVEEYKPATKCVIRIGVPANDGGSGTAECRDDSGYEKWPADIPSLQIIAEDAPPPIILESSEDSEHKYQLVRHLIARDRANGREWNSKAEVIQIDRDGTIIKRLVIYEDVRLEVGD